MRNVIVAVVCTLAIGTSLALSPGCEGGESGVGQSSDTDIIIGHGGRYSGNVRSMTVDVIRGAEVGEVDIAYELVGQIRMVQVMLDSMPSGAPAPAR